MYVFLHSSCFRRSTQSHEHFLLFSSRSFIVLGFTFRPMIHFGLKFVQGVKFVFDFNFVAYGQTAVPAPSVTKIHSPPYCMAPLSKLSGLCWCWSVFWALRSVPFSERLPPQILVRLASHRSGSQGERDPFRWGFASHQPRLGSLLSSVLGRTILSCRPWSTC